MANRTPSLENLPDELLADITFRVLRRSVIDVASLRKVCQAFRRHWNTEGVRRVCRLSPLVFVPAIDDMSSLVVAMTQFCQAGNPDALYREGITSLFDNRRMERADEGLLKLEAAAEKGHIKARFLYDFILVCLDVQRRDEGFNILATLMQPTLIESMRLMYGIRKDLKSYLAKLQRGPNKAIEIVVEYQADCDCEDPDGNRYYMDQAFGWSFQTDAYVPLIIRCVMNVSGSLK